MEENLNYPTKDKSLKMALFSLYLLSIPKDKDIYLVMTPLEGFSGPLEEAIPKA